MFSSTITLYSYTHKLSIYTDYNDRNFIFLVLNGILAFLFMNSTRVSSLKQNQSVITCENKHQNMLTSSPIKPKENKSAITSEINNQILLTASTVVERKGNQSVITCETKDQTLSISSAIEQEEEEIEEDGDDMLAIVEDKFAGTEEVEDYSETEEFNKKCEEFIRKIRETMKSESLRGIS